MQLVSTPAPGEVALAWASIWECLSTLQAGPRTAEGVEAHVVQRQAHSRHDRGREPLSPLLGEAREVRHEDRRGNERVHVLRIRRALLQPAPGRGEASLV